MEEHLLTTEQVSKILQVHPFTVLKYIREGKLKGIKLGRVYRIRTKDVEEFLEERSMGTKQKAKAIQTLEKEEEHEEVIEIDEKLKEKPSKKVSSPSPEESGDEEHYVL